MIWPIFGIWSHSALAIGFLILDLGNYRLGQNWSIFTWKKFLTQKFKILSKFRSFWAILVICNPSGSKVRHTGWNFLGPQIALQMTCNGQIAEPNTNEHVLAGALQGNLQLSPNFFWYFSHHIHIFLTLSQDFLTIFWIFQPGLLYIVPTDLK